MAKKKTDKSASIEAGSLESKIEKDFGEGILSSANYLLEKNPTIISVSPAIDMMLGGGIKFGSFVIPTGPAKAGKSSYSLNVAAQALKIPNTFDGERNVYIFNIEGRLNERDLNGVKELIPNMGRVFTISSRPGKILTAENFLEIGEQLINEKPGSIFIFDSFSQLCSQDGREKQWDGKAFRDNVPIFLSQFCKRICNVIPINESIVFGITHRIANTGFGFSPWSEASGNKIQYAVDVKMGIKFIKPWSIGESKIGQEIHWDCTCSPLHNGPVTDSCVSYLRYGYGIDREYELVNMCADLGIIKKGGAWYEIPGVEEKMQGTEKVRNYLVENPEVYNRLNTEFRSMAGLPDYANI